jgi:hypothetical protein
LLLFCQVITRLRVVPGNGVAPVSLLWLRYTSTVHSDLG